MSISNKQWEWLGQGLLHERGAPQGTRRHKGIENEETCNK